jgi:hypothetical protein
MLWVVLVAPSTVDAAEPSTDPRVSAGDVEPESATAVSLDADAGSPAVDVFGSVTVASPDEAAASAGAEAPPSEEGAAEAPPSEEGAAEAPPSEEGAAEAPPSEEGVAEAASSEEGVASVFVFDEAGSVATAVVGSVEEEVVSVTVSEVSCVVLLAASTVVSAFTGVATGSMSTVGSLKVQSPLSPQTFLYTLLVKVQLPSLSCFPRFEPGESKLSPDFFLGNLPRYLL